ncbi:nuclear transcription factor Y subunit B-3-like [Lathyrus oleraceus]|uniref:nuclear transcription factor Y subunit B-3-like n=1 Tax=Pisum sativum TaxID=3888 RepID=UPI0021D17308|nr:nuclear transcription factor Y subunit B-3-like [Pisum sativum]
MADSDNASGGPHGGGSSAHDSEMSTSEKEFISFVTSEASDKCQREKRKTINGDDFPWAMTTVLVVGGRGCVTVSRWVHRRMFDVDGGFWSLMVREGEGGWCGVGVVESESGGREICVSIRRRESASWPFIPVGGVNDISWK